MLVRWPGSISLALVVVGGCLEVDPDFVEESSSGADGTVGSGSDSDSTTSVATTDGMGASTTEGDASGGTTGSGTTAGTTTGGDPGCRPADMAAGDTPGLVYALYLGNWESLPDFSMLTPEASGTVGNFDIGVSSQSNGFALTFDGYLEILLEGEHTFYVASDEGSRLYVGGELVVDNDGLHGVTERSGSVCLRAGRHPVRVEYFELRSMEALTVEYGTPLTDRAGIPDELLTH